MNVDNFFQKAKAVPLQKISLSSLQKFGVELLVRRDDLIDPELSGNKYYKLIYNLHTAKCKGYRRILTFGGAYSNHIHATAAAGNRWGFQTIGLIRGEPGLKLNHCVADAEAWGMQLEYIPRNLYSRRNEPDFQEFLANKYNAFLIPEGGANLDGAKGMQEVGKALTQEIHDDFTSICLASGTGTSLAGIAAGVSELKTIYGFSVLKGEGDMTHNIRRIYQKLKVNDGKKSNVLSENWRLISGFHVGGYAKKIPPFLKKFWHDFENQTEILLDPIYTLKLFWGVHCLIQSGFWKKGSRIIAIHSGGLQGRRGFE